MSRSAIGLLLAFAMLMAGCADVPRPFQPARKGGNELLLLPDRTGIAVAPATGAVPDDGETLASAMAKALRQQNITAAVATGNTATRWLLAHVDRVEPADTAGRLDVRITWELYGADGEPVGSLARTRRIPATEWRAAEASKLAPLVQPSADRIAGMIQAQAPGGDRLAGYPPGTRIVMRDIQGRPERATRALAQAMARQLRRRDLPLADRPTAGDVVITGDFKLGESNGTDRPLELVWILKRAGESGRMGDLRQANRVPVSRIERGWGRLSDLIAQAAVPGVLQVLRARASDG